MTRMATDWKGQLNAEAGKLIARFELYARQLADEQKRRQRRSTATIAPLVARRPGYWSLARGFNPYFARANATTIAHALRKQISDRTYAPRNPVIYEVPKPGGGLRDVS